MKCHCSQNRERLAMLVGQDASPELPEEIRRSLANCPHCREHYQQLCTSQQTLQKIREEETISLSASLWPSLARRLPETRSSHTYRTSAFKQHFVPIFSMAAACLAVLVVFSENRDTNRRIYQTAVNRGSSSLALPLTPVGNSFSQSSDDYGHSSLMPQESGSSYGQPSFHQFRPFQETARGPLLEDHRFDFLRSEFQRDLQRIQK